MADIFISYAQKAPEPTKTLAADLARLKYEYWFDERLLPMEVFGQVINERIDKAKAVITIWSQPALKSKWVYAEALRARRSRQTAERAHTRCKARQHSGAVQAGHITPIEDRTAIYEALTRLGVYPSGFAPIDRVARAFELIEKSDDIEDFEALLPTSPGRETVLHPAGKKEDRGAFGGAWRRLWSRSRPQMRKCRYRRQAMCSCASSRGCIRR